MQILMNKKAPVLELEINGNSIIRIGSILDERLLPMQLKEGFTASDVQTWFSKRLIPEKRDGLREVRMMFRGLEKNRNFFSLTDQYWIRHNKNETWDKGNFFTNRYSTAVGTAFFEPWAVNTKEIGLPSPDLTTNGVLRKCWQQDDKNVSYMTKAGSIKFRQEPLSEVLASMTLKRLNLLPFVEYEMVIHGLKFCAKSKNFINEGAELVPASAVYHQQEKPEHATIYSHLLAMCQRNNIMNAKDYIDKMIVCDHVLCNPDRHLGNFGFIRSADTGMIIGFAPLFDNGSAYWGKAEKVETVKSRLFSDVEDMILKEAKKKGWLKNAASDDAMKSLIDAYPEIETKKKDDIIEIVEMIDKEMKTEKRKTKEIVKEYDMEIDF